MSMLAERKTTPKWVLNPKDSDWSKDPNKLGQKMLEKMGWSAGKGLGAKEQGRVEAIRISYKGDTRGFGADRRKEQEDWLQQQQSFQSLLENLNGVSDKSVKVKSLEEISKTTRTKIHYHKFARGKDISRYSAKDLSCIVGSGFVPFQIPETAESVSTSTADATGSTNNDSERLEPDDGNSSGEEGMDRGRSRSGRVLKPSKKIAEASPKKISRNISESPTRKTTKEKPGEMQSRKESKKLKTEPVEAAADGVLTRGRREIKPSAKALSSMAGRSPSPKKKKGFAELEKSSKADRSPSPKKKEPAELEKPSAKDDRSPSPKKKKKVSAEPEDPSAEASGSMPDRSQSPKKKKKKKKNKPAELEEDVPSKPGPSKAPVSPATDHLHSRSGREYKPTAKVMDNIERSPSPPKKNSTSETENHVNNTKKKRLRIHSESSSSQALSKKQKTRKDFTGEESSPVLTRNSPKKKEKTMNDAVAKSTKIDDSEPSKPLKNKKKKGKNDSELSGDEPPANHASSNIESEETHSVRKRPKTKKKDDIIPETETHKESMKPKKKPKEAEVANESALNTESLSSRVKSRRDKSGKDKVVENGAAGAEEGSDSPRRELKRKDKKKSNTNDESVERQEQVEEPIKELKKEKKKAKKQATTEADENNEERELHSKKGKRTKKQNTNSVNSGVAKDAGENPKASKSKKKPATKAGRLESSESQETVTSKKPDSEDAAEELSSINSQSSLIYEMIGSEPSTLQVGEQPREHQKCSILISDSEGDD